MKEANLPTGRIEHLLNFLAAEHHAPVGNEGKKWHRNPTPYRMNMDEIQAITDRRKADWEEIKEYMVTKDCLMLKIRNALDDHSSESCGKCQNCIGRNILSAEIDADLGKKAADYLRRSEMVIEPRLQIAASNDEADNSFPIYQFPRKLGELAAESGRVLSRWGDAGWG